MKGRASLSNAGCECRHNRPQATRADPLTSGISITCELLVPTADRRRRCTTHDGQHHNYMLVVCHLAVWLRDVLSLHRDNLPPDPPHGRSMPTAPIHLSFEPHNKINR